MDGVITQEAVKNDMKVSIASDVYQGTYQYEELVDMQFVYNAQNNTD
jgi:NitT/TauT family transport system substrate-binding protein